VDETEDTAVLVQETTAPEGAIAGDDAIDEEDRATAGKEAPPLTSVVIGEEGRREGHGAPVVKEPAADPPEVVAERDMVQGENTALVGEARASAPQSYGSSPEGEPLDREGPRCRDMPEAEEWGTGGPFDYCGVNPRALDGERARH
jgi:hypothetical protein